MDNMATNVYTKSNDDRVRLDKALGFLKNLMIILTEAQGQEVKGLS